MMREKNEREGRKPSIDQTTSPHLHRFPTLAHLLEAEGAHGRELGVAAVFGEERGRGLGTRLRKKFFFWGGGREEEVEVEFFFS